MSRHYHEPGAFEVACPICQEPTSVLLMCRGRQMCPYCRERFQSDNEWYEYLATETPFYSQYEE